MRNFILASAVALAAALSTGVAAQAQDMPRHKMQGMHGMHHQKCMMKTVKHRDGRGHWVVKKVRVCR